MKGPNFIDIMFGAVTALMCATYTATGIWFLLFLAIFGAATWVLWSVS